MSNRRPIQHRDRILARACCCEPLESRRMLATYSGTAGNDTIAITTVAGFHRVTINGNLNTTGDSTVTINALDGNDTINVTDTLSGSIFIVNGGNGDDYLQNMTGDLDDTYANFLFDGAAGTDEIAADNSLDDDNAKTFRIGADELRREDDNRLLLSYIRVERFAYGDTQNPNTIQLANVQTAARDLAHVTVLGNGGADFIRNTSSPYWGTTFGTGSTRIDGGAGNDFVDLFNTNATVPSTYTMGTASLAVTSTQFTTGPVSFLNCESVTVEGSAQDESFLFNARPAGLNIKFNGNNGNDAFTVGGGDLDSNGLLTTAIAVAVDGGAGTDSITFDDHLDAEGEIESYILAPSFGNIPALVKGNLFFHYTGTEVQTLDAADRVNSIATPNSIQIQATSAATLSTAINGGANRKCDVGVGTGNSLDSVNGTINANLQGGTVGIQDFSIGRVYRLTQTQLLTPKLINYSGVDAFFMQGSNFIDRFEIEGVPAGTAVSIFANGSNDDLILGTGSVDATILGPVTFDGGADPDTVIVDNSLDATVESQTLNGVAFIDGQTHTFNAIEELTINNGPGGTNFAVNATACETNINGGNGNDSFTVGGGDINSNIDPAGVSGVDLTIDGFGGTDEILFNDLNDNTLDSYVFSSDAANDTLIRAGTGSVVMRWTAIEGVTLDASNAPTFAGNPSLIIVLTTHAPLRIRGNAGSDRITIVDPTVPVFVNTGAGDADQLVVNEDFVPGDEPSVVVFDQTDDVDLLDIKPGGTVRVQSGAVLVKTRLSSPPGLFSLAGVLDLAGGAFLSVAGGPSQAAFRAMLVDGYNSGTWNGTSNTGAINSSLASSTPISDAVGYGLGSEIAPTTIGPFTIAPGDTLVRYTLNGDANLNQTVNGADFNILATNFGSSNRAWAQADFTYDNPGTVNGADFNSLAGNFGTGLPGAGSGALARGSGGAAAGGGGSSNVFGDGSIGDDESDALAFGF